jgi:RHH-type proline utilization regulon transcriptional repressor/proline dehydrogenase/delta 1-pyrroline-5-carboxylate dehydrogenase
MTTSSVLFPELDWPEGLEWGALDALWAADEAKIVADRLAEARSDPTQRAAIDALAVDLVRRVRTKSGEQSAVESLMRQYDLSSEEGVLLMCVAEALLRIPDSETADRLIADKLGDANWAAHLGESDSLFVNASTWGLMLTGSLIRLGGETRRNPWAAFKRLVARSGEPVIRLGVRQAMRIMGHQFVMGRTIQEALTRSQDADGRRFRHSFDMLGESALTAADADRYLRAYESAIDAIGASGPHPDLIAAPSISVKLSALHPRYEASNRGRVLAELVPRVLALAHRARRLGIALTVDAEESERLALSLEILDRVHGDPSLEDWAGFGLAVQAYQKRAPAVIDWLGDRAKRHGRPWCVRLVKGAYWDAEVKRAQVDGHGGYPVYTRKPHTDVAYLACARRLFALGDLVYPQFATHNAHTIAAIHEFAGGRRFEFQRLHGMGSDLYDAAREAGLVAPCRVYAPVGSHEDLLPYLVRRLLENGANTSFVNRIVDESLAIGDLVRDPCETVAAQGTGPHPRIPLPVGMFGDTRRNSMGINLASATTLRELAAAIEAEAGPWHAAPQVPGYAGKGASRPVLDPTDRRRVVGHVVDADVDAVERALANAVPAQAEWDRTPVAGRARILEHAADLMESRCARFIAMCVREAGKSIPDSIAEVREAVDFLRYYAREARLMMGHPMELPGPTGESNRLFLSGRGVFVAISPWNFPLAIFAGQVAAALVTGNAVIAKPAEQTSLIGFEAVNLLHEAGIPPGVLQYLPGDGATVGAALTRDPRVAGVVFTGSTETARVINRTLAARDAALAVLIAETGGQNALIADSSALPEQLVKDAIAGAFQSAGQRCSATRVLFVQADIADKVIAMLAGAMGELKVGDPGLLSTDVGPVIDEEARTVLEQHAARMDREATLIRRIELPIETANGTFVAPRAYEIDSLSRLEREVFGPILHVIRWRASELDQVIDAINATGYGLTLGIHSRIDSTVDRIASRIKAGNCYVNRNMIGAVVGVQPFGGEGLSGTGPKAGGPHYLARFVTERTLTVNTTAAGGNASLLTLGA